MTAPLKAFAVVLGSLLVSSASAASFTESIDSTWATRWTHSSEEKYNGKFVAEAPPGSQDTALKVTEKARHYGIATALPEVTDPSEGLVLQYDLKLTDGLTCGGAYMKFLTADADIKFDELNENSTYSVMFGPDKCGSTNKVHLIMRHKSPKTGEIEEKHLMSPPIVPLDDRTHVYTAILYPTNNSYAVLIDGESKKSGSLFEDFEPPFNPPEEIEDPNDSKPDSWIDDPKISDAAAVKPDDWDEDAPEDIPDEEAVMPTGWLSDEPAEVDDADAKQPEDWDEEEDGVWEPPRISNPLCKDAPGCGEWQRPTKSNPSYKGKWTAPMIDNPAYKGVWKPAKISNPEHFKDDTPLAHIGKINAAAIEIWTMDNNYYFDDIVVANDPAVAKKFAEKTWAPKSLVEKAAEEAKKLAEEAKQIEEAAKAGASDSLSRSIDWVYEKLPFLEPLRELLQPAVDFLVANAFYVRLGLGLGLMIFVYLLSRLFARTTPVDRVGVAKKTDAVNVDDTLAEAERTVDAAAIEGVTEEELVEEIEEEAEAEAKTRKRPGRPRRET